jgi:D-amino-acid dehydrogenase
LNTESSKQAGQRAVVVGGGIVGVCCALYLQREGLSVTLIDPAKAGESTAKWSCGQISIGEVIPLSKPGILTKIPGWMLDQTGPLALRPQALPTLVPWFMRFISNARPSRIENIATAMSTLTHHVFADYARLLGEDKLKALIVDRPIIQVFDSSAGVEGERAHNELRRKLGFESKIINGNEIAELEPTLAGKFNHGILLPQWRFVADTEGFIVALTDKFIADGGKRIAASVDHFKQSGNRASAVVLESGENIFAEHFVVASGIGARRFFSQLELNVPLQPVAGYQVVVKNPGVSFNHSVIYGNGGFCFSPMTRGLQIGGTIEFAGKSTQPNFRRAELILSKAKKVLPQMDTSNVEFGIGYRPLLPDTKPVIDRSAKLKNVLLAIGHGQLGLTLGAVTGRLIADLVAERHPDINLSPFSAYRF